MVNIAALFPKSWQVTGGKIKRGGGRDKNGNYQEPTELELGVVLLGPNVSEEERARTDLDETLATLYGDSELGHMESTDVIWLPAGFFYEEAGWVVVGEPKRWPLGIEIHLRKV